MQAKKLELMNFSEKTTIGNTDLKVGRLGIASSYRAPAEAYEEAFEKGCNYFTLGSFIRGSSSEMKKAIINILKKNPRESLVISMVSYAHNAWLTEYYLKKRLKELHIDYADVLLLGHFSKRPPQNVINGALKLKKQGLTRYIGITSHNRKLIPELHKEGIFDLYHIRYNAANSGAETDIFPHLPENNKPGIISFTATRWGQLLKKKKMPDNEPPLSAVDCYKFVLSNPSVDICMSGAKSLKQMKENLEILNSGPLSDEEMSRIRKIGDYVYHK